MQAFIHQMQWATKRWYSSIVNRSVYREQPELRVKNKQQKHLSLSSAQFVAHYVWRTDKNNYIKQQQPSVSTTKGNRITLLDLSQHASESNTPFTIPAQTLVQPIYRNHGNEYHWIRTASPKEAPPKAVIPRCVDENPKLQIKPMEYKERIHTDEKGKQNFTMQNAKNNIFTTEARSLEKLRSGCREIRRQRRMQASRISPVPCAATRMNTKSRENSRSKDSRNLGSVLWH